jgi:hypothetical protein
VRRVFRSSPEQPRFEFDWQRTGRLAAFGGAIAGPLGHVWFQALDANIMPATPRRCGCAQTWLYALNSQALQQCTMLLPCGRSRPARGQTSAWSGPLICI